MPYGSQYPVLPVIYGNEKIYVTDSAGQTTDAANNVTPTVIKTFINAVEKSGSTMSGFLTLNANPTSSLHAATKSYVDTITFNLMPKSGGTFTGPVTFEDPITLESTLNGITTTEISYLDGLVANIQNQINSFLSGTGAWKTPSARVAMMTNVNISSPGATLQSISMVAGDRVLLNGQTTGSQNGVYVWNGAAVAMTRSTDCSTGGTGSTGVLGMIIAVMEGTYEQNAFMIVTDAPITIGTTPLSYVNTPFTTYTAGNGITLSANNFTLNNSYFSGAFTLSSGVATLDTVTYLYGGTGLTAAPTNGQLAIGNGTGYALSTITAGSTKLSVTNGSGSITLDVVPANIDKNTLGGSALSEANGGTGLTSLGIGVATWLGSPSSANLLAAVSDETGTGSLVFSISPNLLTPTITQAVNAQTGTTYTFVATDFRGRVTANNASAQTYTCPQQSTLTTAAGVGVWIENIGSGNITIVKEGSETLSGNSLLAPGGTAYIFRTTTTNWSVFAGSAVIAEQITGSAVGTVVNQAYEVSVYMPFPGTILGLALKTTTTTVAGTYTVAVSGGNVTGLTTVVPSASGVRTYTSATAANTFVRGNYITITFAGSTIVDAFWMLEYTRTY